MTKENLVKCEDGSKTQTRRSNKRYANIKRGDTLFFRSNYKTTYAQASGPYLANADAKVQRLKDIGNDDAIAEGIVKGKCGYYNVYGSDHRDHVFADPRHAFGNLINRVVNGKRWNMPGKPTPIWDLNPEVVVIYFEKMEAERG
jgi:hypothetical protein